MNIVELTTTVESKEQAHELAERFVQKQLAACVQITGPIESVYRWKNSICKTIEYRCSLKTADRLIEAVQQELEAFHPYDVPEVLITSFDASTPKYEKWLAEQLVE